MLFPCSGNFSSMIALLSASSVAKALCILFTVCLEEFTIAALFEYLEGCRSQRTRALDQQMIVIVFLQPYDFSKTMPQKFPQFSRTAHLATTVFCPMRKRIERSPTWREKLWNA